MRNPRWWTPERIEVLRQLVGRGMSWREAAAELSRRYHRRITKGAAHFMGWTAGIDGQGKPGRPPKAKK